MRARQTRDGRLPLFLVAPGATLLAFSLGACVLLSSGENFILIFTSPETASRQGYTTDGTYHYTSDNTVIYKRMDDEQWSIVAENRTPFAGLSGRPNHLGDLDYHDDKLYVPAEEFLPPCGFKNQQIAVYDAGNLSLLASVDVSAQGMEISGVAVVPEQNLLHVASFCDGSKLWRYDLSSLNFEGTLNLSRRIPHLQGLTWDGRRFYASSSDNGSIYAIEPDGRVRGPVLVRDGCEAEGLKWHNGTLRWSVNQSRPGSSCQSGVENFVHFYRPLLTQPK
ncbi:MAG: hypothetical protein L0338_27105 [Acidobacteria bacterium]|nr:hypothetical protein [Acidobacteriota bacterium]